MNVRALPALVMRGCFLGFAVLGWLYFLGLCNAALIGGSHPLEQPTPWLYDWHVYYAGAVELVNRTLYHGQISVPGWPLPVDYYNLPPASAALAVPFLPLGRGGGGLAWVVLGMAGIVGAAVLTPILARVRWPFAWAGVLLGLYAAGWPMFIENVTLGNVNPLMFAGVAAFALAHLAGRERSAGALLGVLIAVKIWPLALVAVVGRERRWRELRWATAIVAVQGFLFLAWLGPRLVPDLVTALRTPVPVEPWFTTMWTTWARELWDWWPAWGSVAIAAGLLAIPARRELGVGLGILAGLSLIANVWNHYIGFFVIAAVLIGRGLLAVSRPVTSRPLPPAADPDGNVHRAAAGPAVDLVLDDL